jgi:tetratricopeptide (TPR) repeat protein
LELQKENPGALLNRAISHLINKKLDLAKRDYDELLKRFTTTNYKVYYGLGEIAYQQKDWKAAKGYYKEYLTYAPASLTVERKIIQARLDEMKKKS